MAGTLFKAGAYGEFLEPRYFTLHVFFSAWSFDRLALEKTQRKFAFLGKSILETLLSHENLVYSSLSRLLGLGWTDEYAISPIFLGGFRIISYS